MTVKEGFVGFPCDIFQQINYLVNVKGMDKLQAVAELEALLRVRIPDEIIERLVV